jgi:hypothetical protein
MENNDAWPERLPPRAELRREIQAMVKAIRDVTLEQLGESAIRGIYHKGSGKKPWDTPIDYVPGVSDVDLHIWLVDADADRQVRDIDGALRFQAGIESAFYSQVTDPIHLPRPQVIILNRLLEYDDYIPSPAAAVEVVFGEPYPAEHTKTDAEVRADDGANMIAWYEETRDFGLSALDKPGSHAWTAARQLAYRVSPVGSRALNLLGVDPEEAWSMNRSSTVARLEELGQHELAAAIRTYYLAGWEYFLSGLADGSLARTVMRHAMAVIEFGHDLVRTIERRPG